MTFDNINMRVHYHNP